MIPYPVYRWKYFVVFQVFGVRKFVRPNKKYQKKAKNLQFFVVLYQVPMEVFGLMQQIYNRAQYSLGPDVGCYAPPMLYEKELNESLQVIDQISKHTQKTSSCSLPLGPRI